MTFKILKATKKHALEIEKIHLSNFQEIGEKAGLVNNYLEREVDFSLVAVDESDVVVGYLISATYGERSWLEWIGVSIHEGGVAQLLMDQYFEEMRKIKVKESVLMSRNRFKKAISFYLKNDYDIKGLTLGSDNDLMITMKKMI